MLGLPACQQKLSSAAANVDVVLVEGVMGLYDGTPSAADLARAFGIPVLLVIDASAMAQTVGALVFGMQHFGNVAIAGVIANKVASQGHADFIASSLRDCPLLGYLPPQAQHLPERHLGLVLPNEVGELHDILQALGSSLQLDRNKWDSIPASNLAPVPVPNLPQLLHGKTIAIARDAAFAFLYPANLQCLQALGATLVYFSPLADQKIPKQADALYLPGGYPELHADTLSRATRWQASVRAAQGAGMPIWAECGGMMALCDNLIGQAGQCYAMAGLLPGTVQMRQHISAIGPQAWHSEAGELRGHTFHFSSFASSLAPHAHTHKHTDKHPSGQAGEAIFRLGQLQASYFHAYFPSCPQAAAALFLPRDVC
jgi:cobyrinic acid a,c-diamide synthase